jgi:hypothetical protein
MPLCGDSVWWWWWWWKERWREDKRETRCLRAERETNTDGYYFINFGDQSTPALFLS